jgi:hypothetical protein
MQVDMKDLNPGVFFPFDEDNEKDGITLRVMNTKELERIFLRTQVKKVEVKGNPPSRFTYSEYKKDGEEKEFEMTWDYCIMDWKGVIGADGKEIPCTSTNKVALMSQSHKFSSFVTSCAKKINEESKVYTEELEGN